MSEPVSTIYSISQLNQSARLLLEQNFPLVWVKGEISNLSMPSSGHVYFSLKDNQAQVRCAMFAMRVRSLNFPLKNGLQVLIRAKVSLYEGRGDFQLIVEYAEAAGAGALQQAYEALKQRLAKAGLFDSRHKKSIPQFPHSIGVITSPTGAAIRDILSVLKRRSPGIKIYLYPTMVQGQYAALQIADAIQTANEHKACDLLIVARGGGSLEDLWPFNEEIVANAIFNSELPIVTGIGHEIDFTIADFVADQRAPTPSAAAEFCSPDYTESIKRLLYLKQRLSRILLAKFTQQKQLVAWLHQRLQHPKEKLLQQSQRLDDIEQRLLRIIFHHLQQQENQLSKIFITLQRHNPLALIEQYTPQLKLLAYQLNQHLFMHLQQLKQQLLLNSHALETVSPLATLQRGYAIIKEPKTGKILRRTDEVKPGDTLRADLAQGQLLCKVIEVI